MTMVMRLLVAMVLGLALAFPAVAKPEATSMALSTYFIPVTYTSGAKTNTSIAGLYGYFGKGAQSLELEVDLIHDTNGNAVQKNYLLLYRYYGVPQWAFKGGVHLLQTESGIDKGTLGILGAEFTQRDYYYYPLWSIGSDLFLSQYSLSSGDVLVVQGAPYLTTYFNPYWIPGTFDLTAKFHSIWMDKIVAHNQKQFNQLEMTLNYHIYPVTLTGRLWSGETMLGVYDGGVVAYNTTDRLKDGFGLFASYAISPKISLKAGYQQQRMEIVSVSGVSHVSKSMLMLNVGL